MSKTSAIQNAPAKPEDFLDACEIGVAFDALSEDDQLKLDAIEAICRRGTAFGKGELIHEAVCRALLGERKSPRDVVFMAFLVNTMKSIAFHARKTERRSASLTAVPRHGEAPGDEAQIDCPSGDPTPEDCLLAKETVAVLHDHFSDDPEAQLVLMGWADGLRGTALREATDLDQAGLDYAIKRIRTRIRKLYPQGWIS